MEKINKLYQNFRSNRISQLQTEIADVVNYVREVADNLPEDEMLNVFKKYPIETGMALKWKISQDKVISFLFNNGSDEIKIGKDYQFSSDCIKNCNEILRQFEYGLKLAGFGYLCICKSNAEVRFKANKGTQLRQIERFIEDIHEAFPNSKTYNHLDIKSDEYCSGEGWITISIDV